MQVASTNAMGVLVVLAGGLAGDHSWRGPFFAYAIAIVLLLPVFLVTYEPPRAVKAEAVPAEQLSKAGWRLIWIRCAQTFFVSCSIYALIVQVSFLLAERGVANPSTIGFGISFGAGGIALGSIANTAMLSIPARLRLLGSYVLTGAGVSVMALNPQFAAACGGGLAAGLGAGCAVSTLLCVTVSQAPEAIKGQVTGAWTAAMFLGQFLNPPIFLGLVRLGGSYGRAFAIYAAVCAALAIGAGVQALLARSRQGESR